jgi:hypothetical protein
MNKILLAIALVLVYSCAQESKSYGFKIGDSYTVCSKGVKNSDIYRDDPFKEKNGWALLPGSHRVVISDVKNEYVKYRLEEDHSGKLFFSRSFDEFKDLIDECGK